MHVHVSGDTVFGEHVDVGPVGVVGADLDERRVERPVFGADLGEAGEVAGVAGATPWPSPSQGSWPATKTYRSGRDPSAASNNTIRFVYSAVGGVVLFVTWICWH